MPRTLQRPRPVLVTRSDRAERGLLPAVGAILAMAGILIGVPALLVQLGAALPIDVGDLAPGVLFRSDDGGLLLLVLLALAWGAWVVVVLSLALEGWASVRRIPTPRLPGLRGPQRMAAALVASLVVLSGPGGSSTGMAVGAPSLGSALAGTPESGGHGLPTSGPSEEAAPEVGSVEAVAARDPGADLPSVTAQRHDTLWMLAETHLGSGERYTEIVALNEGVRQPDGRALGTDGRLYPGWTLRLPADARASAERPDRHRVEPGDTLWEISEEQLGDPTRYPEVFAVNAGDLQPDGRRLTDPDLILPGWVLEIPGTGDDATGREAPADEAPADEAPTVEAPTVHTPAPGTPAPEASEVPAPETAPPAGSPEAVVLPPLDRGLRNDPAPAGSAPANPVAPGLPALDRAPRTSGVGPTTGTDALPVDALPSDPTPVAPPTPESTPTPTADASDQRGGPVTAAQQAPAANGAAEAGIGVPAGGLLAVLLLAGFAREVTRRRRLFQRHRRPGERMPHVDGAAHAMEQLARDAAAEAEPDLLDRALVELAGTSLGPGPAMPRVRLVRVSTEHVWLDLADDRPEAPEPFVAVNPRCWRFDPRSLGRPATVPDEHVRALAGLVTLGVRGDETVLVDLAEVGTLTITGSPSAVPGVLRALASELALGPARASSARTLCLSEHALSEAIASAMEAGEVSIEADPERIAGALAAAMRGGEPDPWEGDPVELVLADRPVPVVVPGRSGAALITTDASAPAGATLELDGRGGAVLHPDGLALVPQTLAAAATSRLVEVLAATQLPTSDDVAGAVADDPSVDSPSPMPAASLSDPTNHVPPAPTIASGPVPDPDPTGLPAADPPPLPPPSGVSGAPRILMLGPLEVVDAQGRAESTRYGRLSETAAFVLLNPGTRPSELQSALWPGRRSNPQTCRQMISRARTWLGRTAAGDPYLMAFTDTGGRLRLREEVGSDWADFQQLAQIGLADPHDTEHLTAALALVRGRPFGAVAARELPWADLHINDMISLITDVAHELALRHERAGRWSAAREAALRGLRTESESEVLAEVVARVTRTE